ncbi:tryptophan 7-halogenase [Tsukamurella sp. 8F]|uniref:NAD(P)/FAD-dependent oxidoreductase n=1 Tax=unclassified Tsukamurella TaxID=2633480 RepID=UPI0023B88619|nr:MULTISPECIES: tryptophan 7-halogenase [unclassified Tsukamurella]MDF0532273.1 tryptophan 7-halogenase [Tsukamurella sp. 8J]MDF0589299.1 tryptophan 7-halogenase [Tsukamurella sp. 8F]
MNNPTSPTDADARFDVAIMGGGAAGLTLAMQLSRTRPGTSIVVVERAVRAPEAAHKVGESTVDIGARYMRDVLGIETHMVREQLDKFGLRFFFSQGDNRDIARRAELGHAARPNVGATYQIDRGRFENYLADELSSRGVGVWTGRTITDVELGDDLHRLTVRTGDGSEEALQARWLVDASGRAAILKRKLGLAAPNEHNVNAAWFRIDHPIDIDEWSTDEEWHDRITDGRRHLSTNHLMGEGYWVWLIPLSSEAISVGIVADADLHPFREINRFDRALEWLRKHEPQCAEAVQEHQDKLLDFRVLKNYSYGCEKVYSEDRWCLTGEAGIFLDPLYSPGFDVISMSNGFITDLVARSLDGEDVTELTAAHNNVFFLVTDGWLPIYEGQYPIMGNARIMSVKVIWDTGVYWAVPSLLYFHDQFNSLIDEPRTVAQLARMSSITVPVQRFFREWYDTEPREHSNDFVTYYDFDFMSLFHNGMSAPLSDDEFSIRLGANLDLLERLAGQMVTTVIAEYDNFGGESLRAQADRWRTDAQLQRLVEVYRCGGSDVDDGAWPRLLRPSGVAGVDPVGPNAHAARAGNPQ